MPPDQPTGLPRASTMIGDSCAAKKALNGVQYPSRVAGRSSVLRNTSGFICSDSAPRLPPALVKSAFWCCFSAADC